MIRIPQPDGGEAFVCSERCWLAESDSINRARQWAMQPIEPYNGEGDESYINPNSISWTDKDRAIRCSRMIARGACGVTLEMLQT